jgi:uncharacterized protein YcbK (DUF882 family)|tara:strand:- start:666 stop:1007 length:342 start_codon:yes stop_codon:yes gene_type:complete
VKYFKIEEFDCQETGENEMLPEFLHVLDDLRDLCGFPFVITSGYRSPKHSIEAAKTTPGTHAQGIAVDIKVSSGEQKYTIVRHAMALGFSGVGVADTFVHVDYRPTKHVMWTY